MYYKRLQTGYGHNGNGGSERDDVLDPIEICMKKMPGYTHERYIELTIQQYPTDIITIQKNGDFTIAVKSPLFPFGLPLG